MAEKTPGRLQLCGRLFLIMLYISTFTFGGGFVIVSLMKRKLVDELHWLEDSEMLDMTAIAQSSPGAIAVNASILVGQRLAGIPGIAAAVCGTMIPPLVIITVISFFYQMLADNVYFAALLQGMQAGVAAVIADVVYGMAKNIVKNKKAIQIMVMIAAFVAA
ncbi:MAG: chromate transporter, partial [Eubacteriales bacterium]|nr:chromate transporter [Eubacteriales bacterium]